MAALVSRIGVRADRGSVLVLALFLLLATLALARLCLDVDAGWIATEKAATAADFGLLSALRVRASSLEAIAARWDAFGAPIQLIGGQPTVPPDLLAAVAAGADALRRALPGYQGRITSALTVASEANGADRTLVTVTDNTGLQLGLQSQRAALFVPGGPSVDVNGLWLRRRWSSMETPGAAAIEVAWRARLNGSDVPFARRAAARVAWDADPTDGGVQAGGNGGFSPDWGSATTGALFRPDRYPLYRADLGAGSAP
jgi:hypothetical protein